MEYYKEFVFVLFNQILKTENSESITRSNLIKLFLSFLRKSRVLFISSSFFHEYN